MIEPDFVDVLGPALADALERKGFTELTAVQKTVLDAALAGRDLRMTSQTGSGKTVAIGFALRDLAMQPASSMGGIAHPHALVVAPTRELAKQVEEELSWLYAQLGARVVSVTGGVSLRDERRALASGPAVVVGTPGRMLDHLNRGAIDPSEVGAVVLDEADRLLDLGFREELEAILAHTPEERRTHLVSATFPRDVRALADSVQRDAAHVEGSRLGEANADIEHLLHLVDARDRLSAMVNILLANPEEQTLIFARTRADVAEIAEALSNAGFPASSLSGEMEQNQRDRAMAGFKRGDLRVLVATDVAARGIDVQDIARVIHADPPGDADTYTHRSGRTGRAGRKGVSSTLVPPSVMAKVVRLLHQARVPFRFEKIPSAAEIRKAREEHLYTELTRDDAADAEPIDAKTKALAEKLAAASDVPRILARLLKSARQAVGPEPRDVRPIEPPTDVTRPSRRSPRAAFEHERPARPLRQTPRAPAFAADSESPADSGGGSSEPFAEGPPPAHDSQRPPRPGFDSQRPPRDLSRAWTHFQVSWGEVHGADSRRMLAMLCRRGGISSGDVGSIRIGNVASTIEIATDVADRFAEAAGKTDLRDPRIVIRPASFGAPPRATGGRAPRFERTSAAEAPRENRYGSAPAPRFERSSASELPREDRYPSAAPPREERHASAPPPARFERSGSAPPPRFERGAPGTAPARERPKAPRPKGKVSAKDRPVAKGKGWVKRPKVAGGDAPPKRRAKA